MWPRFASSNATSLLLKFSGWKNCVTNRILISSSEFPPDHLVDYPGVRLDELDDLRRDVLVGVVRHGDAVVPVPVHLHGRVHRLEQRALVDAGEDEAALVEGLGPLGRGPDAHGRERVSHALEEAALLRQRAAVAHHREGVHLEAVVVVESKRLVADDPSVQPEPAVLESLSRARMAGVQYRHVVLLGHCVDGVEQRQEVPLRVYVLLPVRRQQYVPPLLEAEPGMDVRGLYLGKVPVEHLRHRGSRDVRPLLRHPRGVEVSPGVLRVAHVHIRYYVYYPAVGLLRQALVEAPVPRLHMEDRYVQPLGAYDAQAGVRVPEHKDRIRLQLNHQLVARVDDVAHRRAEVLPDGIQVDIRVPELQVPEEHPVEVVVIVLPRMGQQAVEILPALVYHGREPDYLRPRPHDDQQLQPPIACKSSF